MQRFSISSEYALLCDNPRSHIEIRSLPANEPIGPLRPAPAEVVICVVSGELTVSAGDESLRLHAMQGVQIPVGLAWAASSGSAGAKLLRVDSFHPALAPDRLLMPPLTRLHSFDVASNQWLVYTDHVRGGVLTFAPTFAADKHFHQDADEIFWFFEGTCRVTTPDGAELIPAGEIVYTEPGEWHIIENAGDTPLLMFLTVTPNIVPSHTFFDANGAPHVRNWEPLRNPPR